MLLWVCIFTHFTSGLVFLISTATRRVAKGGYIRILFRNKIISFQTDPVETTLFLIKLKSKMARLVSYNNFHYKYN